MHKYMKIKGLDSREITSSSKSKSVMSMACHFRYRWKKTYAPHKTHLHTTWIIERLDRKLVDVISYNTWKSVTSHVSLSLSSTEDLLLEKIVRGYKTGTGKRQSK